MIELTVDEALFLIEAARCAWHEGWAPEIEGHESKLSHLEGVALVRRLARVAELDPETIEAHLP